MVEAEVLVAGGGPSACAAAIVAAREGLHTVLVTRQEIQQSNVPTPVQSLHAETATVLRELAATEVLKKTAIPAKPNNDNPSQQAAIGQMLYHVDRPAFDHALLQCAQAAGATVIHDSAITELERGPSRILGFRTQSGTKYYGRWVLDGTGHRLSIIRALPATQQFLSPPLFVWTGIVACKSARFKEIQFRFEVDGWQWRVPMSADFATWTALSRHGTCIDSFIYELVAQSFKNSVKRRDARWRVSRPMIAEGYMAMGEAAGELDPAWGRGVLFALSSGFMASYAVIEALRRPQMTSWLLASYDAWAFRYLSSSATLLDDQYREGGFYLSSHL